MEKPMDDIARRLEDLEARVFLIERRNERVESDKAWETSFCRKSSILVLTYFSMCLVFWSIGSRPVLLNAVVPTFAFFLSTLSLPLIRENWRRRFTGKEASSEER
jgi:hypothetical protein